MRLLIIGLATALVIVAVVAVIFFANNGKGEYYKMDYSGGKGLYIGAKDSYKAGAKVTLYYPFVATDTDYSFYLNDERVEITYSDFKGFKLTFTMPSQDSVLSCNKRNSMEYIPPEETSDEQ